MPKKDAGIVPDADARLDRVLDTPDPIELALTTPEASPAAASARALIDRQHALLGWQIAGERMNMGLKVLGGLVGLVVAVLFGTMVWNAARSNAVVVQSFDTPPALAEKGLSGTVVAGRLQDGLSLIQTTTRAAAKGRSISNAWTGDIAVEVPQTGVSISELDRLLREKLGHNTYVSGDLVQTADSKLALTVRGGNILAKTFVGEEKDLDALARQAAEYVYGQAEPYLYASFLNQNGRYDEVLAFVSATLPSVEADQRAPLANAAGVAHASRGEDGDGAASVAQYRLAIQFDPTYWRSWGNLVGALYEPGKEEQAFRAGVGMRRADAASRTSHPAPQDYNNVRLLEQDWRGYVEGLKLDAAQTSGGGSTNAITANPSIAEGEARRHDWSAAARYMGLADPADPATRPTGWLIDAYRAMDGRDFGRMVERLEPFDTAWRADTNLAFTYVDGPCWLGYAYAMSGQAAKAKAIFDRMGALVVCYAFQADGIEATGDRAAADAAYVRAIGLAPSMPFAYQRRALALMGRGQYALAAGRFADAHARGPNWADPLKGWGDALAAQGRWAEAAEKYEQAQPLAPAWRELRLAHAMALERLGKRAEARKQREAVQT